MVKAIIFDCFGVLTKDLWREFTESLLPGEGVRKAKELNHRYDAGLISLEEFIQAVHEATGHDPQLVETVFTNTKPLKNTELLDYIRELKRNYKIGMLSNIATNWVRDHFLTPEEQKLFDTMVFSFEVGTTKPDPRIYEVALHNLGVEPHETVFIDDVERYCLAAEALGMKAVWYKNFPHMKTELEQILSAGADN